MTQGRMSGVVDWPMGKRNSANDDWPPGSRALWPVSDKQYVFQSH